MDGTKSWWSSKGVIGPIVAVIALGSGVFFGAQIDAGTQAVVVDQTIGAISAVATLAGTLLGLYGRITATKKIG